MTDYSDRLAQEKSRFDAEVCVHDLPDIFHYWSNKYLRPLIKDFGYDNIEDFFVREIAKVVPYDGRIIRVASVGCGDCATEVQVAAGLVELGMANFHFTCLDISDAALTRGQGHMRDAGLEHHFTVTAHDFNQGLPTGRFDVVMANQSLHHVIELERLYGSIKSQLAPEGCFLVSDMIGRNGHQRWSEARAMVNEIWEWLPSRYRYNWQLRRQEDQFLDWDCSNEGFEGVRAQDVLPLLLQYFSPKVFIAWSNIIDVFIDRGFGHHFREQSDWDHHFIDRVQALDSRAIASGKLKPTHLLARFQLEAVDCIHIAGLPPAKATREVD